MYEGEIRQTDHHYVATIGGSKNSSAGMGTVNWRWKDDHGISHAMKIKDVLFFPDLPVNILSITCLADQFKDDDGTGIDTKQTKSRFYWDNNQFQRTINHPASNVPELPINEGFSLAARFTNAFATKVCREKTHCHCHLSQQIPEDDSEKQTLELSSNMFHVGETLLYTNEGHTTYVRVDKIFLDDDAVLRFHVHMKDENLITTTQEYLRAPDALDIGWIPSTVPDKRERSQTYQKRKSSNYPILFHYHPFKKNS
jgi:hypothetical protein